MDYKCESCSKSFSQADHMIALILKVHKGHIEYKQCQFCDIFYNINLWISNQFLANLLVFSKNVPISFGKYTSINAKTLCFVKYESVLAVLVQF